MTLVWTICVVRLRSIQFFPLYCFLIFVFFSISLKRNHGFSMVNPWLKQHMLNEDIVKLLRTISCMYTLDSRQKSNSRRTNKLARHIFTICLIPFNRLSLFNAGIQVLTDSLCVYINMMSTLALIFNKHTEVDQV